MWNVTPKKAERDNSVIFFALNTVAGAHDDTRWMAEEPSKTVHIGWHSALSGSDKILRFFEKAVQSRAQRLAGVDVYLEALQKLREDIA